MAVEVLLPKIGFSMNEGELVEWLVADGGQAVEGEPLYALEDAVFARMGDARVQEMMDAIALFNMIFEKETEMIK